MTRRYGAAGMIGLGVALWQSQYRTAPSTVLAGLAAWFFVQGGVALAGLLAWSVSTLTWFAAFADLSLGIGALILVSRVGSTTGSRLTRGDPPSG